MVLTDSNNQAVHFVEYLNQRGSFGFTHSGRSVRGATRD